MNYRKIYEKHYGVQLQQGEVIHHVDENRDNNEIGNLLALPKDLHIKWHKIKNQFLQTQHLETVDEIFDLRNRMYSFCREVLIEYIKVRDEVEHWVFVKRTLDMQVWLRSGELTDLPSQTI